MRTYYEVLGISKNATDEEIKQAYRKLMKENHPDNHVNESKEVQEQYHKKVQEINEAYSILGNKDKKAEYDLNLTSPNFSSPSQNTSDYNNPFNDYFSSVINERFRNVTSPFGKTLEEEYDSFIQYLNQIDEETKEYGLSTNKIRDAIKNRRGSLTIAEITKYKRNITSQLDRIKTSAKKYDELESYYNRQKEEIERRGGILPNFEEFLPSEKRTKLTEEEYRSVRSELNETTSEQVKIINDKLRTLDTELKKRGSSIVNILIEKKVNNSNSLTKSDLKEIERRIELIDAVNSNLRPLNITLYDLLAKLKMPTSKITNKLLELINNNILEYLKEGNFAKWKITHMNLEELEEASVPKM